MSRFDPCAVAPDVAVVGYDDPVYVDSGLIDLSAVDVGYLAATGHCSPDSALGRSVARVLALAANRDAGVSDFSNSI